LDSFTATLPILYPPCGGLTSYTFFCPTALQPLVLRYCQVSRPDRIRSRVFSTPQRFLATCSFMVLSQTNYTHGTTQPMKTFTPEDTYSSQSQYSHVVTVASADIFFSSRSHTTVSITFLHKCRNEIFQVMPAQGTHPYPSKLEFKCTLTLKRSLQASNTNE
jgi:predicted metal-binding membrane protein